ncbi:peptidoglycan-binding protein LysM [Streptomyces roseolilacinus]|uniref:Peptidoglycan-binding protein LysM n=1 Tax=Streptomyces roseolilacinus TaxID=66904 RepID=A0A918AZ41_9ACTN|nr:peptidoglycan-binding protein LysM [Streptomyces roseolilacinus]
MTGSAIALPLLGAGTASAADATTWDRVAECETGGMWSADLGNGYYGGLQLSQETWQAHGGTAYAPRADLASRSQQIAVAEKVFAAQGAAAWETCAPIAGLTDGGDSAPAEATPEVLPEPSASTGTDTEAPAKEPAAQDGTATGAEGTADPGTTPEGTETTAPATPDASATPTAPSADPAAPEDAPATDGGTDAPAPGTGKHRGEPAKEEAGTAPTAPGATDETIESGNAVTGRETDRNTSRGDGAVRTPEGLAADGTYTVRPGDNLSAIAQAHEVPGGWTALYDANRETVGTDPDLILPGQSLDLGANEG